MDNDFIDISDENENISQEEFIDINNLFDTKKEDDFEDINNIISKKEKKKKTIDKDKKIERIQFALLIILVVLGTVTYFFGYDVLKPFIKVD